jgi:hypothetical protein
VSEVDVTPRSRRAILGAALGGVAAAVAGALGRPAITNAADGNPVLLGANNASAGTTEITSSDDFLGMQVTSAGTGLQATGQGGGLSGQAYAVDGVGVGGYSMNTAGTGRGQYGFSAAANGVGVLGVSNANSTGVTGYSFAGSPALPAHPDKVGVFGYAAADNAAKGVVGKSTVGTGVDGSATSGTGVRASASTGTALAVTGRATFSRSGRASVPANKRYVDVTPAGGLAPTALVVATLETYRSGVWVTVARKNYPSSGVVRIYLNKVASTTSSTVVGWIAIN